MKKKSSKKKWLKPRHKVITEILRVSLGVFTRIKYNIKAEKFKEQEKRPYLILFNHQTPFDQFFVGISFKGPVYYLASEDIFSKGWISSLIKYLVAPIPIKKQAADFRAVINCMHVAREGGTIAIAPEGNRTYSGKTEYINPSIVTLAKKLALPIALYRIEGGYGAQPRWADKSRKGKMRSYVSRVIFPEEYANMSNDELYYEICSGIYVNEAKLDHEYKGNALAEYIERALYVCPECGLSEFESHGDIFECKKCKLQVRYMPTKEMLGINREIPFRFFADWYDYQSAFINSMDVTEFTSEPMYTDRARISEVIPNKKKCLLCENAGVELYGDRIALTVCGDRMDIPFTEASTVTVLGRNKLNIYFGDKIYQLKGEKSFCALKYVNIYHRFKNIAKGEEHAKFLGL